MGIRGPRWNCTKCSEACEHVGAVLALILEEKTALVLAATPPEREPIKSLREEELVWQAVAERQERAATERMHIESLDGSTAEGNPPCPEK